MDINLNDYEIVEFQVRVTNASKRIRAYRATQNLLVSYADVTGRKAFRIYRMDGKPFIETTFVTEIDAIQTAHWLEEIYKDYFFILEDYPSSELWQLTHMTIENGIRFRDVIEEIKDKKQIGWADVQRLLN